MPAPLLFLCLWSAAALFSASDAPENLLLPLNDSPPHAEVPEEPMTARQLTDAQRDLLERYGWATRTGGKTAVWVSVGEQRLRIVNGEEIAFDVPCATSIKGVGSEMDSLKTPVGWHSVAQKIGRDAPWGQVFRTRMRTDEIWKPGGDTAEDLVLTRILVLAGEEPGANKGGNVDSFARNIYIHGTNNEARIGTPSSHGCIRLRNDDVIKAFSTIPEGAPVLITVPSGDAK